MASKPLIFWRILCESFSSSSLWQRQGEWARAESDFTQYLTLKPEHADAYASRGIMRFRQGRAAEAQQDFDQCLALKPHLRQSLEQMIEDAKQRMATKR